MIQTCQGSFIVSPGTVYVERVFNEMKKISVGGVEVGT